MPLKSGKSEKTISRNIGELHHGPRYAANRKKFGSAKANAIAEAAAYSVADRSGREKHRGNAGHPTLAHAH
jgi:hypothetical protein